MNLYCRPSVVMADVAGVDPRDPALMAIYAQHIEDASREVDAITGRHFYTVVESRLFDVTDHWRLAPPADLLSVSGLWVDADLDHTPELQLTEDVDFWLAPENQPQKWYLDVHPKSAVIRCWPKGRRRVRIEGVWGYSNETAPTGLSGTVDDSGPVMALSGDATGEIDLGETLVVGEEQMFVEAVNGTSLLVTRGANGTTPAAHENAPVYRRRYPRPIEEAVKLQVVRLRWSAQGGHSGAVLMGDEFDVGGRFATALYPRIRDLVKPFRAPWKGLA